MEKILLRRPTEADEDRVWAYRQAFLDRGETVHGSSALSAAESYSAWLRQVRCNQNPQTVRPGLVVSDTLMAVRAPDGVLVGFIDIRHTLNDFLMRFGGHIGYSVQPDLRRRGYAAEMLRLALDRCRNELGLERVLLTCGLENEGSRRTILANGGVLENEIPEEDGTLVQRYWIAL
ncbi:GNAT family N-acetyltransferase [Pseudoflavonifractor phocaeensis]|uniref:GNAT family N-acetyltransferase n=1 Tax=Pseudoflavonifractor phocaeensis TaxID=1870988 RepID=UPI00210D80F7|nr:GNAT family N-acetyltransferase [Pseudoflavonifractor phocaeensis]MCQ4865087.1 GNAT family N-acetyltransferase [Pseudoflavonifractor phocaeensis]